MVEIESEIECALVEDRAERHHRAVGIHVASRDRHLREPCRAGLLNHSLGAFAALAGNPGVRAVLERSCDRAVKGPRLGAADDGRHGQVICDHDPDAQS